MGPEDGEFPEDADGHRECRQEIDRLTLALAEARRQKDGAYSERNKLVSAMSKVFPSWLQDHDINDTAWEKDWRNIVFISLPTGQASWHLHDSELSMFTHLSRLCGNSWDGHTNEQKYERLAALTTHTQPQGE